MPNLLSIPLAERPRERLTKYGLPALSLSELLQIILGQGHAGVPVSRLAEALLCRGSLLHLSSLSIEELMQISGIGLAKAAKMHAVFELAHRLSCEQKHFTTNSVAASPSQVVSIVKEHIRHLQQEQCWCLSISPAGHVAGLDVVAMGTLTDSVIHPREFFRSAIRRTAVSVILCHNHPGGIAEPSDEDVAITERLELASGVIGVPLIDHIIISESDYFSFREHDLL